LLKDHTIKLLRRVKKHILAEPKRLQMGAWGYRTSETQCGTAACIGGWAAILNKLPGKKILELPKFEIYATVDSAPYTSPKEIAVGSAQGRNALEITPRQATRLFFVDQWPWKYQRAYVVAERQPNTFKKIAVITAERIEHFIKTGGEA
jgi:hypothetical protein